MPEPKAAADVVRLPRAFPNLKQAIKSGGIVKIVAVGSSSTAGRENILPYPCWLEKYLRDKFSPCMIDVINRGVGGEDAPEELDRLRKAADEKPAMIIWQVGTNAIFREERYAGGEVATAIEKGLDAICTAGLDVLVMDLQYAPALLRPDNRTKTLDMVRRIADIVDARPGKDLQLFRRFALMQYWHEIDQISFDKMADPTDGQRLHQSDWSTQVVSLMLRDALAEAVK